MITKKDFSHDTGKGNVSMSFAAPHIPLARHIETLLLQHDCVIVPDFGGFITNYVEAQPQLQDLSAVIYPPLRVVRFNQSLTQSDGLLVGSYMSAYDAAYPAAEKQMRQDVLRMVDRLKLDGRYELKNIGTLHMDLNRNVTLEATADSGLTTPAFYGFPILEMPSADALEAEQELDKALSQTTIVPVVPAAEEEAGNDTITVTFRRRWVDIAISAAAAVLLFFLFSYPMMREPASESVSVAGVRHTDIPVKKPVAATPAVSEVAPVAEEQVKEAVAPEDATPAPQPQEAAPAKASCFSIVLASYVAEPNALDYVAQLAKQGLKEGRFERVGKVSRVLYGRYATEEEGQQALKKLREESKEFSESWVMEVPN